MDDPRFAVRQTPHKGLGVFARERIAKGARLAAMAGDVSREADLDPEWFAMQIGDDLWLASEGSHLDDYFNHSCDPNAGFVLGDPVLYALRDIAAGAEICWDYSTSISEMGWTLDCACGAANCRGVVRSWLELNTQERERLRPIALQYLRDKIVG
ncbi:MAG: SET domain-containing protein [Gemmataceae bacterium]|nr:SET domain-containing protein [Gemmataceae bacterium]MCI0737772.1 SET domain-containing protein [Gemmataceae bacterium]